MGSLSAKHCGVLIPAILTLLMVLMLTMSLAVLALAEEPPVFEPGPVTGAAELSGAELSGLDKALGLPRARGVD